MRNKKGIDISHKTLLTFILVLILLAIAIIFITQTGGELSSLGDRTAELFQ